MEQTASELAVLLGGSVAGNPEVRVRRLAKIEFAGPGSVSFLANPEYEKHIYDTKASVVIVASDFAPSAALPADLTLLKVEDPYRAFARLLEAYDAILKRKEGVHPTATVNDHAVVGEGCYIGPGVVVEHGAVIGDRVELHAHVHVSRDERIGDDTAGLDVAERALGGVFADALDQRPAGDELKLSLRRKRNGRPDGRRRGRGGGRRRLVAAALAGGEEPPRVGALRFVEGVRRLHGRFRERTQRREDQEPRAAPHARRKRGTSAVVFGRRTGTRLLSPITSTTDAARDQMRALPFSPAA